MNVKELIEKLKDFPEYTEVTDGAASLYSVEILPAYYDGCYTKLYQNKEYDVWNITGCKIESVGNKLKLSFLDWEDVIENKPDAIVVYDSYSKKYEEGVEKHREKIKRIYRELNEKMFAEVAYKLLHDYQIIQPLDTKIGHYNEMWYIKGEEKVRLKQGECAVVLEMNRFTPIQKEDYVYWQFNKI